MREQTTKQSLAIANDLLQNVLKGKSVNLFGEEPTKGYMVSLKGGLAFDTLSDVSVHKIAEFIDNCEDKNRDSFYFGVWSDDGKVYVDLSVNITDEMTAINLGRDNGQRAIYSLNTERIIQL